MAKAKKIERPVEILVPVEPDKIYVYKRDWKLLQPVPYKSKTNEKAICQFKNRNE